MVDIARPRNDHDRFYDLAAALVGVALLGLIPIATAPLSAAGLSSVEISALRFGFAFLTAIVWTSSSQSQRFKPTSAHLLQLVVPGFLLAATSYFYVSSLETLSVGIAITVCFGITPIVSAALNWRNISDRTLFFVASLGLICALVVASDANLESAGRISWIGITFAFFSGVCLGLYSWAIGQTSLPTSTLIPGQFAIALTWHLPLMVFSGTSTGLISLLFSPTLIAYATALGVLMTGVSYVLFAKLRAEGRIRAETLSVLFCLEPALAVAFANFFLGQTIGISNMVGIASVVFIAGLYSIRTQN